MSGDSLPAEQSVEFSMRQGDRCRNYGPEHERTENENCIVTLADEVERLRGLLKAARCPNVNCDNAGTICVATPHGPEPEPCQWCDERKQVTT